MGSPSARLPMSNFFIAGPRAFAILRERGFGGARRGVLQALDVKDVERFMSKCLRLEQLDNSIAGTLVKLYS